MKRKSQKQSSLSATERLQLLSILQNRFEGNMKRHKGLEWSEVQRRLQNSDEKLWSLYQMEHTGGEPDVVGRDRSSGEYIFFDCSAESPGGRRSLCYDLEARTSRKEHAPENSALELALDMGIEILSEEQYRHLQTLGKFDSKTSSWLKTPANIRALGGAIFADFRYATVFIYHNGAQSYYAARGFRGWLRV